jgi:hypothetical protein
MTSVPSGVFLLNPKNREFIEGRAGAPANENPLPIMILRWIGAVCMVAFVAYWVFRISVMNNILTIGWPLFTVVVFFAIGGRIVYWLLKPIFWYGKFQRGSRVVFGEVVSCEKKDLDEGPSLWRMKYRFPSPAGRMLEGTSSRKADERPTPTEGTPVAVAYLSDNTHRVL